MVQTLITYLTSELNRTETEITAIYILVLFEPFLIQAGECKSVQPEFGYKGAQLFFFSPDFLKGSETLWSTVSPAVHSTSFASTLDIMLPIDVSFDNMCCCCHQGNTC